MSQRSLMRYIPYGCARRWCMVTIVSVGYGDLYPYTPFGKAVATATMLSGVLIIALPVTVLATNFAHIYTEWDAERRCSNVEASFRVATKLISSPAAAVPFEEKYCAYQGVVAQLERIETETNRFVELCACLRVDEDRHIAWLTTVAMQPQMVRCLRCLYTQMSFNHSKLPCVPVDDSLEALPIHERVAREKEASSRQNSDKKDEVPSVGTPGSRKSWRTLRVPSNDAAFQLPNPPMTAPMPQARQQQSAYDSAGLAVPSSKANDAQFYSHSGMERSPSTHSLLSLSFERSPLPSELDLAAVGSVAGSECDFDAAPGHVRVLPVVAGAAAESYDSVRADAALSHNDGSDGGRCNLGGEVGGEVGPRNRTYSTAHWT